MSIVLCSRPLAEYFTDRGLEPPPPLPSERTSPVWEGLVEGAQEGPQGF